MANEISMSFSLTAAKTDGTTTLVTNRVTIQPTIPTYTWTAAVKFGPVDLSLSTTGAAISKGSIGDVGAIYIRNLDDAITILATLDGTNYFISIPAGQMCWIPVIAAIDVANVKIKSASATPLCEYAVLGA